MSKTRETAERDESNPYEATGNDHNKDWARQGQAWDAFVNEMWAKHRPALPAPTDDWKRKHEVP